MNTLVPLDNTAEPALPHGNAWRLILALVPDSLQRLVLTVREDWRAHYMDASLPGFRAVAVHRFGTWVHEESGRGLVRGPIRMLLSRMYLMMFRYVRNHYGIELPHTVVLGRRVVIGHQSGIVIHSFARIGDDCIIRQNVTIGALNAERADEAPVIGRRVEFGAGATIVGAITIGDGSRIGPHAVVMTDVPPESTVFVNPPRMIMLKPVPANPANTGRESQIAGVGR
jgi:serine O-acetyltransferase